MIQPSGKSARIRRIQSHGSDVETSGPGTRTALNLRMSTPSKGASWRRRDELLTSGPKRGSDVVLEARRRLPAR